MKNKLTKLFYNFSLLFRTLANIFITVILTITLIINLNILNFNANSVEYDLKKAHHGENSFKTKSYESFWLWLKMLAQEGNYPLIEKVDVQSIIADTDLNLINSAADLPRATWIGHSTVLVQYMILIF